MFRRHSSSISYNAWLTCTAEPSCLAAFLGPRFVWLFHLAINFLKPLLNTLNIFFERKLLWCYAAVLDHYPPHLDSHLQGKGSGSFFRGKGSGERGQVHFSGREAIDIEVFDFHRSSLSSISSRSRRHLVARSVTIDESVPMRIGR